MKINVKLLLLFQSLKKETAHCQRNLVEHGKLLSILVLLIFEIAIDIAIAIAIEAH